MKKNYTLLAFVSFFVSFSGIAQNPYPILYPFYHGVASGDPMSDRVIIWTRITGFDQPVTVNWLMATDTALTQIVQSGSFTTDSTIDYTIKVDVTGLQSDTWYYYQFEHNGRKSVTGRTKTFPENNNTHIRLAVVSCAKANPGIFYNAYNEIGERNDLQAVVHLGDYIYEGGGSVTGRGIQILPMNEIISLQDYRTRHNTYRLDPDMKLVHQQYPFINVWDDHETANDSWENGAEEHDTLTEGPWAARKAAGQQAYFEWMPIRPHATEQFRIYRTLHIGNLADLIMIDSRLEGRDLQATSLDQNAYADTNRTILGQEQMQWLKNELSNSTAQWKIIGNQVMFAPLQLFGLAFSYEQWDGYQADRNRIINHVMDSAINNIAVITGDIHTSWGNDVPIPGQSYNPNTGAGSAFVEFITPSISTGSDVNVPVSVINLANPHIKYVELTKNGYLTLDIDSLRMQGDWYNISNVDDTIYSLTQPAHWYVSNNEHYLKQTNSSATGFENQAPFAPLGVDNEPSSIQSAENQVGFVNIYPNPFQDEFIIDIFSAEEKTISISIYSLEGKKAFESDYTCSKGNSVITIPFYKAPAGNYYLYIEDGSQTLLRKKIQKISR